MLKSQTIIILICLAIVGGLVVYGLVNEGNIQTNSNSQVSEQPEPTFCTMDAKMCPDGSYVGRTGPNCEFVCPE